MILWDKTKSTFGYDELTIKSKDRVIVACDACLSEFARILASYKQGVKKNGGRFLCHSCATKSDGFKSGCSVRAKKLWEDEQYIINNLFATKSDEYKRKKSEESKLRWQNPAFRDKMMAADVRMIRRRASSDAAKKNWCKPEYRAKLTKSISDRMAEQWKKTSYRDYLREVQQENTKNLWEQGIFDDCFGGDFCQKMTLINQEILSRPEVLKKLSAAGIKNWEDEAYRQKMAEIRRDTPRVSSIQTLLYSILDDLGVKYYREHQDGPADEECLIGPWTFDCVIPRNGKWLLIECQGEYWHSLKGAGIRDAQKSSYITNNFSDKYELKYIWEHEFSCKDKVVETLKYWLGLSKQEQIDYGFDDLIIKIAPAADYRLLLGKYHYLPNAGRGGIAYGAYFGDELIAVCVFSPLARQNIDTCGLAISECKELSRLCLHPSYRKKNFLSWFVSRCLKQLDAKMIISYCDTTYNHDGAAYKACNFIQDRSVPPDYWYTSEDGWVMHKRTLYGHANRLGLTESEFAKKFNYMKVYGKEKYRFIYNK